MRIIKFRGKDKVGEWHYGDLLHHDHDVLIIVDDAGKQHKIINETLGQFTGLQDDSKIDIYEGDIICSNQIEWHCGIDKVAGIGKSITFLTAVGIGCMSTSRLLLTLTIEQFTAQQARNVM